MNSRFSEKTVLLCSGLLTFAMSSAYAESSDVTPLVFADNYVTTGAYSSVTGLIETCAAVTLSANAFLSGTAFFTDAYV
jgi:hypothetical protein